MFNSHKMNIFQTWARLNGSNKPHILKCYTKWNIIYTEDLKLPSPSTWNRYPQLTWFDYKSVQKLQPPLAEWDIQIQLLLPARWYDTYYLQYVMILQCDASEISRKLEHKNIYSLCSAGKLLWFKYSDYKYNISSLLRSYAALHPWELCSPQTEHQWSCVPSLTLHFQLLQSMPKICNIFNTMFSTRHYSECPISVAFVQR